MEILEMTFGQKIGLVLIIGACLWIAVMVYATIPKKHNNFDDWIEEVVYLSQAYKRNGVDILQSTGWKKYYDEGLSPEEALEEYLEN